MFTEKRKQILELVSESKEGYNINQIARLTNSSPSWTYEILKKLAQQGHLIPKQMGNAVFFTINTQNLVTQKIIELIRLEPKEIPKREEKQPKIIQQIEHPTQKYERQEAMNYTIPVTNQTPNSNFYNTSTQQMQTAVYGVTKANDVQGMLFNYAATGSGGLGYSNTNTFTGSNQHYGSTGAPPINTLSGKISENVTGFTFTQHTTSHNSGASPGCRYCRPEVKL